jgi:hypothetical protein
LDATNETVEVMRGQLESMNSSSQQTQDLINATRETANASQSVAEQNKELVAHAGEQAAASQTQANAAVAQAEVARQALGTAASSAQATKRSAETAEKALIFGIRPQIGIETNLVGSFAADKPTWIELRFFNEGNSAGVVTGTVSVIISNQPIPPPTNICRDVPIQITVYPHKERIIKLPSNRAFTTQEIDAITNINSDKRQYLFVCGEETYGGTVGGIYILTLCNVYRPEINVFGECTDLNVRRQK